LGDAQGVRQSLNHLALCVAEQDDDEAADAWLQECLTLAQTLADKAGLALALRTLGWLALLRGDLEAARRWSNESLAVGQEVGDKIIPVRMASRNLAEIDLAEGHYANTGSFAEKWFRHWAELSDLEDRADVLRLAGFAALGGQGDYAAAHRCLEECLLLRQSIGHQPDMAQAWLDLGYTTLKRGDLVQAARYYADSLRMAQRCNHRRRIALALRALAALARQQGQPVRAARLLGASETADTTLTARLRSLPLLMQQDWADDPPSLQTQLGEASFIAAQMEGQTMPLEQAIAYALTDLEA
jgi:tetratricopeptide (TPR) repeat protein